MVRLRARCLCGAILNRHMAMLDDWGQQPLAELDAHKGRAYVLRGEVRWKPKIPNLIQPVDREVRRKAQFRQFRRLC